ncbi:MAG: tripartite tricarboxylate transporter substrate binding protein [Betaproteobacteria bacterium]|nr:tripartite tricarboxylate transporter substrate binding protein [Betaproteobacteria bacterium]
MQDMRINWRLFAGFLAAFALSVSSYGAASEYPNKPIRIVTAAPGGGADFAARVTAQGLTDVLGRQVIVENRGLVAIEIVAKALPDGYTVLLYGSALWLAPFTHNVSWEPVRDFSAVAGVTNTPNILVVHPSVPVKSVQELIALAKAKPGELNYASGSIATTTHLGSELFKAMAGVDIVRIAYKGNGPALIALLGGTEAQLMFANVGTVAPHVKSGKLRALAVTTAKPTKLAPGVPTVSASGLPGYLLETTTVIVAPAGTPARIVNFLSQQIVKSLNEPATKERFFNSGVEVVGSSPEQLAAEIKADMVRWGKVIKDAGIRVD